MVLLYQEMGVKEMFSDKLKELREKNGLTQMELAEILNISKSAIANYESGLREPKNNQLWKKIASYFNVTVDYLMDIPDIPIILAADNASVEPIVLAGDTINKTQQHRNALADKIRNSDYTDEQLDKIEKMIELMIK